MNSGSPAGGHDGLAMLETSIRAAMTALGARLLEQLLDGDAGHRGPRVDCGAGHEAGFVGYRTKKIDSVLGAVLLRRAYYHCPTCRRGVAPRDEQLDVVGVSLSPGLAAMTAGAGAAAPFAQAAALLTDLAGISLTSKRVERSAEAIGAAATAAQAEQTRAILAGALVPRPLPGRGADMLYLAIDGTGLPMRASETTGRAGKGPDGRARTREAKLAALFTQTPADTDGRPVRDPDSTSYLATLEPVEHFADLLDAEARRRGADRTGPSVREHQERTVANFLELRDLWAQWDGRFQPICQASCPFMPVLQGWTLAEYWTCVDLYAQAGVRLADYPLVGLGSVCRRQATGQIETIVRSLGAVLPLHGFGVKTHGLARYARWLTSADSMAWSIAGRHRPGCRPGHASEANCQRFALTWRSKVLAGSEAASSEQLALFSQHGRTPDGLATR